MCCAVHRRLGSFGSTAHGAGRVLSRSKAVKTYAGDDIVRELGKGGIGVRAESSRTVAEEAPAAYKDIDQVADVSHRAGIALRVARLVPLGVVKGSGGLHGICLARIPSARRRAHHGPRAAGNENHAHTLGTHHCHRAGGLRAPQGGGPCHPPLHRLHHAGTPRRRGLVGKTVCSGRGGLTYVYTVAVGRDAFEEEVACAVVSSLVRAYGTVATACMRRYLNSKEEEK
jgi:hypothetical protein